MAEEQQKPRLEVYLDKSILVEADGSAQSFAEGFPTHDAKRRLQRVKAAFDEGFLESVVLECTQPDYEFPSLDANHERLITTLVDSVTSEVGRAIVGLSVLQLAVKAIEPTQSIRLHKGGGRGESFSWEDGIPMRVLDKHYCTPVLRKYGLIRLNADGVFMTRSLAENYPYSKLYKAALRGAKEQWIALVDELESGRLTPLDALRVTIRKLVNRSADFEKSAGEALLEVNKLARIVTDVSQVRDIIRSFVDKADYSARLFEIALHSLFQVAEDRRALQGFLKPLSQMRSANKKHGNIGDIEVLDRPESLQVLEAWDAKYGKSYLREELDELSEKLRDHPETKVAGFVVNTPPDLREEILKRRDDVAELHGVSVPILSFDEWVQWQMDNLDITSEKLAKEWLLAFAESLCHKRRDRAPIDEPSDAWVKELASHCLAINVST